MNQKKERELKFRVEFEPSRVAKESLASAYEELIPVARQSAQPATKRKESFYQQRLARQLGGVA